MTASDSNPTRAKTELDPAPTGVLAYVSYLARSQTGFDRSGGEMAEKGVVSRFGVNMVGRPAIPFCLSDCNGVERRLEDFQGRWLLLVFHRHLG